MKIDKVREMDREELAARVDELKEEIFRTRIQKETGQLDQVGKLKNLKKDYARVKTVLRELELEESRS